LKHVDDRDGEGMDPPTIVGKGPHHRQINRDIAIYASNYVDLSTLIASSISPQSSKPQGGGG
jgi:hypothetical protein